MNSELMSYSMVVTDENGSSMHMSYALMGDAVVITVDQTSRRQQFQYTGWPA